MERALYCQYNTLQRLCENDKSWRFNLLPCLPSIYLQSDNSHPLPSTKEGYLAVLKQTDPQSRYFQKLNTLEEKLQSVKLGSFSQLGDHELVKSRNSLFADVLLPESAISKYGVETLRDELTRHWFQNVVKGDKFAWSEFFKDGNLPASNAVLIMDRYFFKVGVKKTNDGESLLKWYERGGHNLVKILDTIIPESYSGNYYVLVVFDDTQIERRTKKNEFIPLESALTSISQYVISKLSKKKCKIILEYLAIHNGEDLSYCASEDARLTSQFLKQLYNLTHDRRIISNYFMVNATHGWDAIDKKSLSTETQTLYYDSLCSGIDNPDQLPISGSIPINYIQNFIDLFVGALNKAKPNSYKCFNYLPGGSLTPIGSDSLDNTVLRLSRYPIKPEPWNPMDRLFQRG